LFYLTKLFIACGLILLPSELFRIVISCKMFKSSMKFIFIRKISVIQEKLLVFFNLLDITRSGAGSRPAHPSITGWVKILCTKFLIETKEN